MLKLWFSLRSKQDLKWSSLRRFLWGHIINSLNLNRCPQAVLAGNGVFSFKAIFFKVTQCSLYTVTSAISDVVDFFFVLHWKKSIIIICFSLVRSWLIVVKVNVQSDIFHSSRIFKKYIKTNSIINHRTATSNSVSNPSGDNVQPLEIFIQANLPNSEKWSALNAFRWTFAMH